MTLDDRAAPDAMLGDDFATGLKPGAFLAVDPVLTPGSATFPEDSKGRKG